MCEALGDPIIIYFPSGDISTLAPNLSPGSHTNGSLDITFPLSS